MYCKKCFKIVSEDSRFCNYCGAKIEAEPVEEEYTSEIEIPKMVRASSSEAASVAAAAAMVNNTPKVSEPVAEPSLVEPARTVRRSARPVIEEEVEEPVVVRPKRALEPQPVEEVKPKPISRPVFDDDEEEEVPKRKAVKRVFDDEDEEEEVPKRKSSRKVYDEDEEEEETPKRKRRVKEEDEYEKRSKKRRVEEDDDDDDDEYYDDDDEGLSILEIILIIIALIGIVVACIFFKPWNIVLNMLGNKDKAEEKTEEPVQQETVQPEAVVEENTEIADPSELREETATTEGETVQEDGDTAPAAETTEAPKAEKKIEVLVDNLRIRSTPEAKADQSNFKGTFVTKGKTYTVLEETTSGGYTWYRIGDDQWVADQNGEWAKVVE